MIRPPKTCLAPYGRKIVAGVAALFGTGTFLMSPVVQPPSTPQDAVPQRTDTPEQFQEIGKLYATASKALFANDIATARKFFQAGYNVAHAYTDYRNMQVFQSDLGIVAEEEGRFDEAEEHCCEALHCAEVFQWPAIIAICSLELGAVQRWRGEYPEALTNLNRALTIRRAIPQRSKYVGPTLQEIGDTYLAMGQWEDALQNYDDSLTNFRQIPQDDPDNPALSMAYVRVNMAEAYRELGLYDDANACIEQALPVIRADKRADKEDSADALPEILQQQGALCLALHDDRSAQQAYQQALDASRQIRPMVDTQLGMARSLIGLGEVEAAQGHWGRAVLRYEDALHIYSQRNYADESAACQEAVGYAQLHAGQLQNAVRTLAHAVTLYRDLVHHGSSPQPLALCLSDLGDASALLADPGKALTSYEEAQQLLLQVYNDTTIPGETGQVQERMRCFYGRYARVLMELHQPDRAFLVAESGRAQGLMQQRMRNRAYLAHMIGSADADKLNECQQALDTANKHCRSLRASLYTLAMNLGAPHPGQTQRPSETANGEQQQLQQQLGQAEGASTQAETHLIVLQSRMQRDHAAYKTSTNLSTLDELRDLAGKHPDTLYLEWSVIDPDHALLFTLSQGRVQHDLISLKRVRDLWTQWQKRLITPLSRPEERKAEREVAAQLFAAIFGSSAGPLRSSGGHSPRHLVLVPDGLMLDVPFAALVPDPQSGRRLYERYALSTAPSLSFLTSPVSPPRADKMLLCIANPQAGGRGIASLTRGAYGDLPRAAEEAKAIAQIVKNTVVLTGPEAREAAVRATLPRYAVVHFAAHARLEPLNGLRSAIVLAHEPQESNEDGFLEAREIAGMSLAAQMAVLSCCETASGQAGGGEGLLGLSWAFFAAGCPSVVASHWKVDDAASSTLMRVFYQHLQQGQRKDEALQAAMRQVAGEPAHESPYYWAAFQVIGNTDSLSFK